jgi:hypothetical protein
MKKSAALLLFMIALSACNKEKEKTAHVAPNKDPVAEVQPHSEFQLGKEARLPEQEEEFIKKFKLAMAAKKKEAMDELYYFEGVSEEKKKGLDSVYKRLFETDMLTAKFEINHDWEAKEGNMPFSVPYYGKLKVFERGPAGEKKTEIPVGIKDGQFYLTIGK